MEILTPVQAIRKKCLNCCANQYKEVKTCPVTECPIWKFRLGINYNAGNNHKSPFLQASYFKGMENKDSDEILKQINELNNKAWEQ